MPGSVLFFGDSNTRGFGVGREARYAALVEADLRRSQEADGDWRFFVEHALSDFRAIRPRLAAAIAKHEPKILVVQCPTGPACYFVKTPRWLRILRRPLDLWLGRRRENHIAAAMRTDPARYATARQVLYEGPFLDELYRWEPRKWRGLRALNRPLARRYGLEVKVDRARYVALMTDVLERIRAQSRAEVVFLGLIAANEDVYPGYRARAAEWTPTLQAALHRPEAGTRYVDPPRSLGDSTDSLLLRDGTHLSPLGHRQIADLMRPVLSELIRQASD